MDSRLFAGVGVFDAAHGMALAIGRKSAFCGLFDGDDLAAFSFGPVAGHELDRKRSIAVAIVASIDMLQCVP